MKASSTTAMGREHEQTVVEKFAWANAVRSTTSGASSTQPVDVTSDVMVMECEATDAQSYRLTLKFWREVFQKQQMDKTPMLGVRFRDGGTGRHTDLVVMSLADASAIMEELEAHRNVAIKSY